MKDLILIGIQGSGKGTQAKILAEKFGYQIFETGKILRTLAKSGTDLGNKIKEITTRGDLVSNELVMEIVEDFINKIERDKPVIFDGIPRSEEQRVNLEALIAKKSRDFQVLEINLSEEEAFIRLMKRAEIEGRADDNPESIKKRIASFHEFTQPLLQVWKDNNQCITVNGEQNIAAVTTEILEKLNK